MRIRNAQWHVLTLIDQAKHEGALTLQQAATWLGHSLLCYFAFTTKARLMHERGLVQLPTAK